MTAKPKKSASDSQEIHYWKQLLQENASSSRLWIEGYLTPTLTDAQKINFISEKIQIPAKIKATLEKISKNISVPFINILQGAWGLLLNRYAGTSDIIFGYAVLDKYDKKQIILKSPIVPTKSFVSNESIEDFLVNLNKQIETSQKHISDLIEKNIYQNEINYLFLEAEGKSKKIKNTLTIDAFPLVFIANKKYLGKLEILFSPAKFTKKSIKSLLKHFLIILEKFCSDLKQTTPHFSILTKDEKQKLLNEWSKPTYSGKQPPLKHAIHDLFIQCAKKKPHNLAVSYHDETLTYQKLDEYSTYIANLLLEKGIQPGDMVAVFMERTPEIIIVMLAIFKIGAAYVPINPKYPNERIQFILSDCNPKIILINNTERIPQEFLDITFIFPENYKNEDKYDSQNFPKVSSDHIAYVIYTSGTTGQPKGVTIKHSSLVNLAFWYQKCLSLSEKDRASQFASQGFDTFFCETIPCLCYGASIHIIDDNSKLTPSLFLPWLVKHQITICDLPTAYLQILFNMKWPEDLNLRIMKVGGESLSRYPHQILSFDIWNIYGPTETTVEATFNKIFEANVSPENQKCIHNPPPIGKPIANSEMYVVDQYLQPVPFGVVGELLIGGECLSPGYLNRPQLNRERFIRNIFSSDTNAKLYRTGDLVRWLEDGNLEFIGRVDHQIKIRGYRIELSEIEATLTQFSDVQEVVVLAKELINGQKTLLAYLTPNLDKIRIPFQERCLITINDDNFNEIKFIDSITEDISKNGIAITGLSDPLEVGQSVQANLKLPGMSDSQWFTGKVIWSQDQRAGIQFDINTQQTTRIKKSIEYYLTTHNLLETLKGASAKRSLRKALKKKLPEYMIPSVFTVLPEFPLTFNGKVDLKALPPPQDFEKLLERKFVAPRNKTESILAEMWQELLGQHQVSITDNFFDLGGNSLLVSHLSVKIMHHFKISIPAKIFFDLPFIPVIAEYIDSKGTKVTYTSSLQEEIQYDAILNENIEPLKEKNKFITKPRGILLTGAGGFLGIFLLKELIDKTDAKIYCLIRKGEFESCAKRLMANINHYELSEKISLANRRIVIIASDIGLDRFGIPEEQYNNLLDKVDVIYHCGAQVNTMASYTNLRNSNVQGTLEVIKFATKGINKSIHYISTLSAAYQLDAKGRLTEQFPDASSGDLIGGYALSKWVSERLLTQLKNRGLPVCIYRSGYILGESSTGITNLNDALLLLMKGCIQLGFAPTWKEEIAILPVDFIDQAIIEISKYQADQSEVFHLDHPSGMQWIDLVDWLNNYGYNIKLCSHQEWLQYLETISPENALFPFLPHFLAMKDGPNTPLTAMDNAKEVLKKVGLEYPEIDDVLLRKYMTYLSKIGFLPAVGRT